MANTIEMTIYDAAAPRSALTDGLSVQFRILHDEASVSHAHVTLQLRLILSVRDVDSPGGDRASICRQYGTRRVDIADVIAQNGQHPQSIIANITGVRRVICYR